MKVTPIIFSAPMILALLEGRKSQTRRLVTLPRWAAPATEHEVFEMDGDPLWPHAIVRKTSCMAAMECPYGKPGDLLYVRETASAHEISDKEARTDKYQVMDRLGLDQPPYGLDGVVYAADQTFIEIKNTRAAADAWSEMHAYRGKRGVRVPPIHIPRWASRITLRLTDVRIERLQDIAEADILAEGVTVGRIAKACNVPWSSMPTLHHAWEVLWESLHGAGSYAANRWLWRLSFEVIRKNVDEVLREMRAAA